MEGVKGIHGLKIIKKMLFYTPLIYHQRPLNCKPGNWIISKKKSLYKRNMLHKGLKLATKNLAQREQNAVHQWNIRNTSVQSQ